MGGRCYHFLDEAQESSTVAPVPQLVSGGARIPDLVPLAPLCSLLCLRLTWQHQEAQGKHQQAEPSEAQPSLWLLWCLVTNTPIPVPGPRSSFLP